MALFKRKGLANEEPNKVYAVSNGTVKALASLKDGVFSEKMMGDGIVVSAPKDATTLDFFAPISGELVTVFPTGHAFGIKSANGLEVLLHIGIDTVNLNGQGFTVAVSQGKKVKAGDKLVTVDVEYVRKNAPNADAIVIVTSGQAITSRKEGEIVAKEELFSVA